MGKAFQPWQHYVVNTAMEIDPVTQRFIYDTVILTLPRQQGKTTVTVPLMTWRAVSRKRQVITYAAQTRGAALEKFRDDHEPMLAESVYADRYEASWQTNAEKLRFNNGSVWGLTATTKTAGHGPTLDLGVLDEAWAQTDDRVDQAWLPAMMTRDSQFWLPSTMGTDASTYFNGKVEMGRAAVDGGQRSGIAYFEWSAPTDADPADPQTWAGCMPALGHTVTEAKIRSQYTQLAGKPGEFARAYCNIQQGAAKAVTLLDPKHFASLAVPRSKARPPYAFGLEIAHDRQWWSAGVAAMRPDGRMHTEIMIHSSDLDLLLPWLIKRTKKWRPIGIGIDLGGPAGTLKVALARLGAPFLIWDEDMDEREQADALLTVPDMRQVAQASGEMYDAIRLSKIVHLGAKAQPAYALAVAGAKTRPLGDAWAWGRRGNAVIAPLVAITMARWVYLTRAHLYDLGTYDVAESVW